LPYKLDHSNFQSMTKMKIIAFLLTLMISLSGFAQKDTIHVVFKTHLDIGFTDLPQKVVDKYMNEYFPKTLRTARIAEKSGQEKFIWTTGSWLVYEFLKTASPEKKAEMESAIRDGLIVWNGYPFSFDTELLDGGMFKYALSISDDLDTKYGRKTIAAKLTDVPGETIGDLNLLSERGIKMLHIGKNPANTRPDIPPVFLWKDQHGNELIVIYDNDYGTTTVIPGFNHILHFAFTGDNKGPQTPEEVKKVYDGLHAKYPNAVIMASTLDSYAKELLRIKDKLPVITAEIGNTWIHSAGTDPKKYASLRALMRLRSRWIAEKLIAEDDTMMKEFSMNLLLLSEHTGGIDEKSHIDFEHYTVPQMAEMLGNPNYRLMVQSWEDARSYISKAVAALDNSPLASEAQKELESLIPHKYDLHGFKRISLSKPIHSDNFEISFDPITGAIVSLKGIKKNRVLADNAHQIGVFWQESFSAEDYQRFLNQYLTTKKDWAMKDFGKPNIAKYGAVHAERKPTVKQAFVKDSKAGKTILMQLQLVETALTAYGLPTEIWLQVDFPKMANEIRYTLQWFGKKACRLPDAYWFSMNFSDCAPDGWKIEKVNSMVSPLDVISKGGRSLHGFNRGVFYDDDQRKIQIESLDCPIVAPGVPSLLDFNDKLPDLSKGWHFNLLNNKWGTNFPTWYSDDAKFRFVIRFEN
jgi:hypothetical protein